MTLEQLCRPAPRPARRYDYDEIARAYAGGMSMPRVARAFGCGLATVHKAVEDARRALRAEAAASAQALSA